MSNTTSWELTCSLGFVDWSRIVRESVYSKSLSITVGNMEYAVLHQSLAIPFVIDDLFDTYEFSFMCDGRKYYVFKDYEKNLGKRARKAARKKVTVLVEHEG